MTIYNKIKEIKKRQQYQLDHAKEYGRHAEVLKQILEADNTPTGYEIGYHCPAGANWCYSVKLVKVEGELYEIVEQFGHAVAAAWVCLFEYNINDLTLKSVYVK